MKKIITLPNSDEFGKLNGVIDIEVNWECPVCGEIMSDELRINSYIDDYGKLCKVHTWDNPCGHQIPYRCLEPKEALPKFLQTELVKYIDDEIRAQID